MSIEVNVDLYGKKKRPYVYAVGSTPIWQGEESYVNMYIDDVAITGLHVKDARKIRKQLKKAIKDAEAPTS